MMLWVNRVWRASSCRANHRASQVNSQFGISKDGKNLRCDLNQKPADNGIRDCNLVHVAPLQLAEEYLQIHRTSLLAPIFWRE